MNQTDCNTRILCTTTSTMQKHTHAKHLTIEKKFQAFFLFAEIISCVVFCYSCPFFFILFLFVVNAHTTVSNKGDADSNEMWDERLCVQRFYSDAFFSANVCVCVNFQCMRMHILIFFSLVYIVAWRCCWWWWWWGEKRNTHKSVRNSASTRYIRF